MRKLRTGFRLMLAVSVVAGAALLAQHNHSGSMTSDQGEVSAANSAHGQMNMSDMQSMDNRLNQRLAAMNAAVGEARVEAMAAVINELVAQRQTMQHMMQMHCGGNSQMASHMTGSGMSAHSKSKCGMADHSMSH